MLLERHLLLPFDQEPQQFLEIKVPKGSTFIGHPLILPNGIHLHYIQPEMYDANDYVIDRFIILNNKQPIPVGAQLVDIVSNIVELAPEEGIDNLHPEAKESQQAVIIYPIFKL